MKRIIIILLSLFSAINAGQLAIQKFPSHYKLSSKEFNADIPNYMLSKQLRSMDTTKLAAVLNSGNAYLDIKECSDGYSMDIKGRVNGGGYWGGVIGFWVGKGAVYAVGYGTIHVVSLATGPLYPVVSMSLSAQFAAPIEAASMVGGACGGLAGAVATGPV
jgi:hypothetical protein